jgi:signal transduction histidine kinase
MRSMFAKTLGWFLLTVAVAIGGILLTTWLTLTNSPSPQSPFMMLLRVQVEEARKAYESGGKPALAAALTRFQGINNAKMVFTDEKGTDLLTGQKRPELQDRLQRRPPPFPFFFWGRPIILRHDASRQYCLFLIDERRSFLFWFLQPQHLWIIGAVILLCYGFSYTLTSPVRRLRQVVDLFGRGDLSVRAAAGRRDEFGQLAASFNKMAERIQTLLTAERRLLLDISHELRSPLARLNVAVELARSGEDRDRMLDRIEKEAQRLNELVGELLQVTRVEGDPSQRKTEPVQVTDLLDLVVEDSRIEAKTKGCVLSVKAEPGEVIVSGDVELLRRAFENVLRNAIRYAPENTVVDVELVRAAGMARVSIRDRGPGVPDEALVRIFDAFYRVDSDRNRASGGVGLGLAIARRAVELHQGAVRAENLRPGLCVTIELPLAPSPTGPIAEPQTAAVRG